MADWQIDLVRSVLDSSDWVAYVQNFTQQHHSKWTRRTRKQRSEGKYAESKNSARESKVGGYSHDQYLLFREFSEYIETLVASKLGELGVSEEDFFNTCEELLKTDSRGPREEMFKETLNQLLSYTSFSKFCEMMQRVYDDYAEQQQQQQQQLGFAAAAAQQHHPAANNEDYELQLALEISKREMEEAKIQERGRRQMAARQRANRATGHAGSKPEDAPEEWDMQVATAQSILKASQDGKLSEDELEVFTPWAEKVIEVDSLYREKDADASLAAELDEKMQELNLLRLKVDLLVAQQMTRENEKRRHDLTKKVETWHEEMVTNSKGNQQDIIDQAEATLDDLLARVADVHAEVQRIREHCLSGIPAKISELHYQELYFFLLGYLDKGLITLADADQIYDRIYDEIGLVDADIIPKMLKLLVLEREEEKLERRVNAMCDSNLQLIASLQQQADEADEEEEEEGDDYELGNSMTGGVFNGDNEDEDDDDDEDDDEDLEDDKDEDNDSDAAESTAAMSGDLKLRAPILKVQSGVMHGAKAGLAPLSTDPKEDSLAVDGITPESKRTSVATRGEGKHGETKEDDDAMDNVHVGGKRGDTPRESKSGGVPVTGDESKSNSPSTTTSPARKTMHKKSSDGSNKLTEAFKRRQKKLQSKMRKLKKARDQELTDLAVSGKSPDEVSAATHDIIETYKKRRRKLKATMQREAKEHAQALASRVAAQQSAYEVAAAKQSEAEKSATDRLAKQIEEKFRVQLDQSLKAQADSLAASRQTLAARIAARKAAQAQLLKEQQLLAQTEAQKTEVAKQASLEAPDGVRATDDGQADDDDDGTIAKLMDQLEVETALLEEEARRNVEFLKTNRQKLEGAIGEKSGADMEEVQDLAFLKVEHKLANRVNTAKLELQKQAIAQLAASLTASEDSGLPEAEKAEVEKKFAKDLVQSQDVRAAVAQIQTIQATANKEIGEAERQMELEIREAMSNAATETPHDPLGKKQIAQIRAKYQSVQENIQKVTATQLLASKVTLQKQLARRRERFERRRRAKQQLKSQRGSSSNDQKIIEEKSGPLADLPPMTQERPVTAEEEVAKIHETFAAKENLHRRELQRYHSKSKDTLQRLLAKRRKKLQSSGKKRKNGRKHGMGSVVEAARSKSDELEPKASLVSPSGSSRSDRKKMAEQRKQLEEAEALAAKKSEESAADLETIDKLMEQTKRSGRHHRVGGSRSALRMETASGGIIESKKNTGDSDGGAVAVEAGGGDTAAAVLEEDALNSQVESLAQKALAERKKLKLLEQISRAARTESGWGSRRQPSNGDSGNGALDSQSNEQETETSMVVHDLEGLDDDDDEPESTLSYLANLAHRSSKAW